MSSYKPGGPPPSGYLAWHEWAEVQTKAGLRQRKCAECGLWRFPQEMNDDTYCRDCSKPRPDVKGGAFRAYGEFTQRRRGK